LTPMVTGAWACHVIAFGPFVHSMHMQTLMVNPTLIESPLDLSLASRNENYELGMNTSLSSISIMPKGKRDKGGLSKDRDRPKPILRSLEAGNNRDS
jgi:hypothetical protein